MTPVLPFRLKAPDESHIARWHTRTVSFDIHGLARLDAGGLVLEWSGSAEVFEMKGTAARTYEESVPVRSVTLPVMRVASVALEGGWWRPRVVLRSTDLAALAGVPGTRDGALTLFIARGDRALARELMAHLEIQQADAALAAAEAPPPLPPDVAP